jgi:hypothetical protein
MAWSLAANIKGPQGDPGADASVAVATHAATSKTPPVDADEFPVADSAASYGLKKSTFGGVKTWIKSWIAKADVGLGNVTNNAQYYAGGTDVAITDGGTGVSTLPSGLLKGAGTGAIAAATAGTDYLTPTGSAASLTSFPTLNQNTTGTASNVTGVVALANGGTGQTTLAAAGILVSGGALGTPSSGNASNLTSFPTLNQNTTGSAATLTTARTINGVSFNGSANIVVVPRVGTTASSGTPTIDLALYEQYNITALAAAITSWTISNGADGLKVVIRIKDNGSARALAFGSPFRAVGVTLPTTTVVSKTLYLGCIYNGADSKLDVVALAQEA